MKNSYVSGSKLDGELLYHIGYTGELIEIDILQLARFLMCFYSLCMSDKEFIQNDLIVSYDGTLQSSILEVTIKFRACKSEKVIKKKS